MSFLFTVVVLPIAQILEFFYSIFYKISDSAPLSVLGLSFVVFFATLPLYIVAEAWQETERETQRRLKPGIDRIKKCFFGDERYMILATFYRQNRYHPIMALRSSFGLLIQVPFFIAAYYFLSHLASLNGEAFFFIKDFGKPDAAICTGMGNINILPILMTLINCASGAIYSRGHQMREKIQIYATAAIFLALLYNSPSALVFYWTMNNVLSLVKNVFYKLKNPKKILYVILCVFAAFLILFPFSPFKTRIKIINFGLLALGIVFPTIPFLAMFVFRAVQNHFNFLDENPKTRLLIFLLCALALALLCGLCIPSQIVSSETANYCFVENENSPFSFVFRTMALAFGAFFFWPCCLYALFSEKTKKIFCVFFILILAFSSINVFCFSGEYGALLPECLFMFETTISASLKENALNFLSLLAIFLILIFCLEKRPKTARSISAIFCLSLFVFGARNSFLILREFKSMQAPAISEEIVPAYHLSKTGRNVIFVMQDRLFSPYVNEIFSDIPEIKNAFDGFVYFPNTISNGWLTMLGAPEVFGGYDFTPYEMNKRDGETLQKKHNEALLTLPVIFGKAGFSVFVSGLPYENFFEYPIDAMYEGYEFIERANTRGVYTDLWYKKAGIQKPAVIAKAIKRNMFLFSIFKMAPPALRDFFYYSEYWSSDLRSAEREKIRFIDNYAELHFLPGLFDFSSEKNSFVMIDNEMTHEPILLEFPEYDPALSVTKFAPSKYAKDPNYCAAAAALKKFAALINHLKENDCYDNTRIIIVSDHGAATPYEGLGKSDGHGGEFYKERSNFIATLLIKDFECRGNLKKDFSFMTNADAPALATEKIVEDAKNPFTKNALKVFEKERYVVIADGRPEGVRSRNKTRLDIKDTEWLTVKDDIYKEENWKRFVPTKNPN